MKKTTPTPQTIRAAWNAATVYTETGMTLRPSPQKIAKAFNTNTNKILKIVNQ